MSTHSPVIQSSKERKRKGEEEEAGKESEGGKRETEGEARKGQVIPINRAQTLRCCYPLLIFPSLPFASTHTLYQTYS
jgi:hypothetical protein